MADEMSDREDELGKLDSIAGDGDHGQGMVLGSSAAFSEAQKAVETGAGIATMFTIAGAAWADGAGGTSGAAWGNAISAFGKELSDARAASAQELGNAAVTAALAFESVGSAQPGDKTMVDATHPFAESLKACLDNGLPLPQAWLIAASSARDGASATVDMVAKKGRARTHGTASIGHEDPGAVSFAMLMNAIAIRLSQ
jgi:dihydroxyacetone kinase